VTDSLSADRLGFGPLGQGPSGLHPPSLNPSASEAPGPFDAPGVTVDAHVDLLALFLTLSAILAGLTAASLLALGLGALGAAWGSAATSNATDVAAGAAAVLFIGVTITIMGFAGACAATATGLRRRRTWSRPAALVLALVMLVIAPFGTALGIYAFWVLLRQRAREILGAANT
jgi:hypothetical protein